MKKPDYIFLVVEDNVVDQIITGKLLKKVSCIKEINIANNGKEGIHWLANFKATADQILIILLDLKMPIMDGFGFLAAFEELSEEIKKQTQIFILSSTLSSEEIDKGRNNQYVTNVMSKPLPINELIEIILPNSNY